MRADFRGGVAIAAAAVAVLGVEAVGMRSGGAAVLVVAGLLTVVAGLLVARVSLHTAGIGTICLAAFTSPWNGWKVGPLQPGDLLILFALVLFIAADIGGELPRIPPWVSQLACVIVLVAMLHVLLPTDPLYLARRVVVGADGQPTVEFQSNLFVAFKFVIGIAAIPVAFCLAVAQDRRAVRWLAISFSAGVAVSGFVAFTDGRGLTSVGPLVTHIVFPPTREAGLTKHPNFLAASCVIAVSLSIWLLASRLPRDRIIGSVLFPGIVLGVYATGSRGGAVGLVLAIGLSVLLMPRFRGQLSWIVSGGAVASVAAFVVFPGFGAAVLRATRLGGGTIDTAGSNAVRAVVGAQGARDFRHSPIDGIGMQVADQAQNVYIQELASGGLLLFAAMLIYVLGGLRAAVRLRPYDDLADALIATAIAAGVFNYLEADLTDRFFYVPVALVVALRYRHAREFDGVVPRSAATRAVRSAVDGWVQRARAPGVSSSR